MTVDVLVQSMLHGPDRQPYGRVARDYMPFGAHRDSSDADIRSRFGARSKRFRADAGFTD